MFTILGGDGKEYGPVNEGKIHEWIAAGRANMQTKARREGETEWKTLGDFPELSQFGTMGGSTPPTIPEQAVTAVVPTANIPRPTTPVDTPISARELVARTGKIDVFECLSKSFKLWTSNFLSIVGVTLLVMFIQIVISMIPILGGIAGLFINGVIYGGLYYFYLGKMRDQPRNVGDAFAGFSNAFVPLMLASLLVAAFVLIPIMPFFGSIFFAALTAGHFDSSNVAALAGGSMLLIALITFLVVVYISVCSLFTFALVIDKGLGPWTAFTVSWRAVNRQWFRVFFVMFLGSLLSMIGVIGLFVGVFLTIPLGIGAMLYAYEEMFNPTSSAHVSNSIT